MRIRGVISGFCWLALLCGIGKADPVTIATKTLPNGVVGTAYNQTLSATGGKAPLTWSISAGSLPGGLTLDAAQGTITGSPTAAGAFNFTVKVADSDKESDTDTQALRITVAAPPLAVTTGSLPAGTLGVAYSQTLAASGGAGGNVWSVIAGSLPAGLTLSGSGTISGAPTAAGTSNFTVAVKDSSNTTASKPLSIVVAAPALTITTVSYTQIRAHET
jgi:hypothetical protein